MLIAVFGLFVFAASFPPLRPHCFPGLGTPVRLLLLRLAAAVAFLGGLYLFFYLGSWI
jgi:hypothetical protein